MHGGPDASVDSDIRVPEAGTLNDKGLLRVPPPARFSADTETVAIPLEPTAVPCGMLQGANPARAAPLSGGLTVYSVDTAPIVTLTRYAHTHSACNTNFDRDSSATTIKYARAR